MSSHGATKERGEQAPRPTRSDPYPENRERIERGFDHRIGRMLAARRRARRFQRRALDDVVRAIGAAGEAFRDASDAELTAAATELRAALHRRGFEQTLLIRSFALTREVAERTLGLRPLDTQLLAGWIMIRGGIAEMATGEGKTLSATLPASAAALAGCPVHVITSNDYLAARDAKEMSPIYGALGLEVASVTADDFDEGARRAAYAKAIVYTTGQQLAFDYLRDRTAGRIPGAGTPAERAMAALRESGPAEAPLLRGLCFALIDEADHVLIDEARTPLILSQERPDRFTREAYEAALALAGSLREGEHFELDEKGKRALVFDAALPEVARDLASTALRNFRPQTVRELIDLALAALHLFRRDIDYLVDEGRVSIIDPRTGRALPDRSWELGLHQLIECKESCETTAGKETLARISFQQFYRRYRQLGGMTGTAREVARELSRVYELAVVRVPPARPVRRVHLGERVFRNSAEQERAVLARVKELRKTGQPLLIGTQTVEASLAVSRWLAKAGVTHRLLNASTHREEADIIGVAGQPGAVTVATNMAGRGTDIRLGDGVLETGGLFVLSTGRGDSARIDRQLAGRSGRRGDPGRYEVLLSLDDRLLREVFAPPILRIAASRGISALKLTSKIGSLLNSYAQVAVERRHAAERNAVLREEEGRRQRFAFAGGTE